MKVDEWIGGMPVIAMDENDVYVRTITWPTLARQERIHYVWHVSSSNGGSALCQGDPLTYYTHLVPQTPGEIQIYCTVDDIESSTQADTPTLTVRIKPEITITAPPEAPDNKFCFNSASPGVATIGPYTATTGNEELDEQIEWSITGIGGSNLTYDPDPPIGPRVVFTFTGLPSDNDEFGQNMIVAAIPSYDVGSAIAVRVFYDKIALNNPGGLAPNWYYYWKQTIANSGTHVYGGDGCGPGSDPGYYDWGDNYFHICESASEAWPLQCLGGWLYDGIDNFAVTCLHEGQHVIDNSNWWEPGGYDPGLDQDHDLVPDLVEPSLGYNPTMQDTDGDEHPDSEDHALDRECDWAQCSADEFDWANPGHQF